MLKKENRLAGGILKNEKTINFPNLNIKIARNNAGLSRFGFIISKKIDKRATARNRIKRKLRSCLEEKLEKISKGYDFLFIIKGNIDETNCCDMIYSQLKKENLLE